MAYETSNPPAKLCGTINNNYAIWVYVDADAATAVRVAGYFTNGWDLGMRVGHEVRLVNPTTGATTIAYVNSASASGGVDVTDGTTSPATDTD